MSKNKGFSLIELSIVLIIMGMLIVGIVFGAQMIKTAKVNGFIGEINEYRVATAAFITKFDEIPGDSVKIGNSDLLGITSVDIGNDDGIIGDITREDNYLHSESCLFFKHLSAADLISFRPQVSVDCHSLSSVDDINIGQTYPGTKLGGSYFLYIDSFNAFGLFESINKLSVFNKQDGTKGIKGDLMKILQTKLEGGTIFSEFSNN